MASRRHGRLLEAGTRAPEFRLDAMVGEPVALSELLHGGPVLLAFFKISCPVCQLTFPFLERLSRSGIRVVGISQNDREDTNDFAREFGTTFPMLLDREENDFAASNDYGISSVPTMFLVDSAGKIEHVIEGWRKREMEALAMRTGGPLFQPDEYVPEWKAG